MFARDPLKVGLAQVSEVLGVEVRPLLSLARAVYRQGGALGVARGEARVVVGLRGVPQDGVFELASVSKPFTAALAGALVRQGRLAWDEPLTQLGGKFRGLPAWITARSLATHTAGLPLHPARVAVTTFTSFHDPYASMRARDVLGSARRWAKRSSRPTFAYSNLGVGVLALALASAAGQEVSAAGYGRALRAHVTQPLGLQVGMRDGVAEWVSPAGLLGSDRLTGFGELAGAGGLFGRAADLLEFGQAHLDGRVGGHWREVMRPPGIPPFMTGVAPGWFDVRDARWHDGMARGTRTALGFHPASGAVVCVLARGGTPLLGARGAVPLLALRLLGVIEN